MKLEAFICDVNGEIPSQQVTSGSSAVRENGSTVVCNVYGDPSVKRSDLVQPSSALLADEDDHKLTPKQDLVPIVEYKTVTNEPGRPVYCNVYGQLPQASYTKPPTLKTSSGADKLAFITKSIPAAVTNQDHSGRSSIASLDEESLEKNMVISGYTEAPPKPANYKEREKWERSIDFIMSCIAFSVGLGNVWRFPYLCYKNGGGAFLIPYFICLIGGGVPIYFLEVALGQFMSQGGISAWNICPIFKGVGYGTTMVLFLLNIYYIVILAWALHYGVTSLSAFLTNSDVPWNTCGNYWNTESCSTFAKGNETALNGTNATGFLSPNRTDAVVEYWEHRVLQRSNSIDEIGGLQWELAICLLCAWIACYFCIWKGIKWSGKIVYVFAIAPYVMLSIILLRGITLPGAWTGIVYYLWPDFTKLIDSQVWIDAGTQIFFSYAVALGCLTALGSYNKFRHNFIRDCTLICGINSCTSLFAGFVVFSILGFMADQQGVDIANVAESGPGLAFIAYPKAVAKMPMSAFWALLFMATLGTLGLDSQFVGVQGFITAVVDMFPQFLRIGFRREIFIGVVCLVSYLFGLFMVTNGGIYVFQLFDYYAASGIVLLWFCCFEAIVIGWVYGAGRFYRDMKNMVGFRIWTWLAFCWKYVTPALTMGILIFSVVSRKPLTYNKTYVYPEHAQIIGTCMAMCPILVIPLFLVYKLTKYPGTLLQKWRDGTTPVLPDDHLYCQQDISLIPLSSKPIRVVSNSAAKANHSNE